MNFEFVKKIDGLSRVYRCCNNAEELALTMPDMSIVASRKSAEAIAKFLYLVAYSEEAGNLHFNDILKDPIVKEFIKKKTVLDAFHYIRKSGNDAAHTLDEEPVESAVKVLAKLHYALGEIATRMKLVRNYPPFDADIEEHPEAVPFDDECYGRLAREMYDEYIILQHKIDVIKSRFSEFSAPFRFTPGAFDLYEDVEFENKPELRSTIYKIQEYFGTIGNKVLEQMSEKDVDNPLSLQLELSVYGDKEYITDNMIDALNGILYDLPDAEGFCITSYYSGPKISSLFEDYNEIYSFDCLSEFMDVEEISSYKKFEHMHNHGAIWCEKYADGEWVDLREGFTSDIVDRSFSREWWSWSIDFVVDFDFEKYPDKITALHNVVRKHIPQDQLEFCEQNWEGNEPELEILLDSIQWFPRKLREVQDFLDDVNSIILPFKNECELTFEGDWFITEIPFAVATGKWTDDGFHIIGTVL